jgi:hypothetical protein
MIFDLFITGDGSPVCGVHLEKYIDDPSWLATQSDYDAYLIRYGKQMSCKRCEGVVSDQVRDPMDVALPETDFAEGGRGTFGSRELDDQIARVFESYIKHPSHRD